MKLLNPLLISLALMTTAQPLFAQTSLTDQCAALMVDPPPLANPPAQARITEPLDGAIINGDSVIVRVETENFDLASGGHWHIWVDDTLAGMVFEPRTILTLEPGTYRICAILGDADHMDLGVPNGVTITVRAAQIGTPTTPPLATLSADETIAPPQPEPQSGVNPALLIGLGLAAAVGGVAAGSLLGRRKKS